MTDLVDLAYTSASTALAMFRSGDLSPRDLMEAVIARAEATQSSINCFTDRYFDEALDAATRAGDAYAKGTARPLEGLAVAVKDESRIAGSEPRRAPCSSRTTSRTAPTSSISASSTPAASCTRGRPRPSSR